jgi:predicted RNA-binding Zn-ribbon protein involved in translation (DUF1610 family)
MTAVWTCWKCRHKFEAPWTGEASMMAKECPKCGEAAIASAHLAYQDGCLLVRWEEQLTADMRQKPAPIRYNV